MKEAKLASRRASEMQIDIDEEEEELAEETEARDPKRTMSQWDTRRMSTTFDLCLLLARKHTVTLPEVRKLLTEFRELDVDESGLLSKEEFEAALRKRSMIAPHTPVPNYLAMQEWAVIDKDLSGCVDFEEFLLWSLGAMWKEELIVEDLGERRLRELARMNNLKLHDVETLKRLFNTFDADHSNSIDKDEFKDVIVQLMDVKNPELMSQKLIDRYWTEADEDHDGTLSFEEFMKWYMLQNPVILR